MDPDADVITFAHVSGLVQPRFQVYATSDVDEVNDRMVDVYFPHTATPTEPGARLRASYHHADFDQLALGYLSYGTEMQIDLDEPDHCYVLEVPVSGALVLRRASEEFVSVPHAPAMLTPPRRSANTGAATARCYWCASGGQRCTLGWRTCWTTTRTPRRGSPWAPTPATRP